MEKFCSYLVTEKGVIKDSSGIASEISSLSKEELEAL